MKTIYVITLFIAALPGLCWSMSKVTWFEAQTICKNKKQSLTLSTNKSSSFYWTGFYNRTSDWIKILGCYNASTLQLKNQIKFPISSPPLCQEYCLQKNILEFAVQGNSCICLPSGFDDYKNLLHSSNCTYTCDKSCLLVSSECGGKSAVNVFSTDTSILEIKSHCLSLQCEGDSKLVDTDCEVSRPAICSNRKVLPFLGGSSPTTNDNRKWRYGMDRCKSNGVYLMGKINLTDIVSACKSYTKSPGWIGVVKENYTSFDQGNNITESKQMFSSCQQCKMMKNGIDHECKYVQCTKKLKSDVYCSEITHESTPLPEITTKTTVLPKKTATSNFHSPESTNSTVTLYKTSSNYQHVKTGQDLIEIESSRSSKDGSTVGTVIPVVVVIVVIGCCALAVVFYLRRLKNKQEKDKKVKSVSSMENKNYTNIESHDVHRNSILQQSNPTYQLADGVIHVLGSESPYNEAENGTYDYLGDKNARKRPVEGIYNHASSAKLSDLSDYDIANHKRLNEEDNNYDHAGVGNNAYGQYNSSPIRESDYSDLS